MSAKDRDITVDHRIVTFQLNCMLSTSWLHRSAITLPPGETTRCLACIHACSHGSIQLISDKYVSSDENTPPAKSGSYTQFQASITQPQHPPSAAECSYPQHRCNSATQPAPTAVMPTVLQTHAEDMPAPAAECGRLQHRCNSATQPAPTAVMPTAL